MKKVFLTVLFIVITLAGVSQDITTFFVFQPVDMGIGGRIDYRINEEVGVYGGYTQGNYKLCGNGYINDHRKVSMGGLFFNDHNSFLLVGVSMNGYGERYAPEPIPNHVLDPVSLDIGAGSIFDAVRISVQVDILRWETAIAIGITL
jgi:hypothetical protein